MYKSLSILAATAAVMLPVSAMAETADSLQFQMAAQVEDICTVRFKQQAPQTTGLTAVSLSEVNIANDVAQVRGTVTIANSDNPSLGTIGDIDTASITFVADFFCNGDYQATIQAANGSFTNADAVTNTADFANRLGYDLTSVFDTDSSTTNPVLTLDANGTNTNTGAVAGSQHDGNVTFTITTGQSNVIDSTSVENGGVNLISGTYDEAVTISFVQDGTTPTASFNAQAPAQATFVTGNVVTIN